MNKIFNEYQKQAESNIMLSFKGEVSEDLVKSILDIVSGRMEKLEDNLRTKKKVFNVLVETLQNLCKHIEALDGSVRGLEDSKSAMIYVWVDKKGYHVATGNYIENDQIEKLKSWLNEINSHTKESLRALYKEVLDTTEISEKGGAGLGFIDIARKSGQKLDFIFDKVNDKYSFFSFLVRIPKEN